MEKLEHYSSQNSIFDVIDESRAGMTNRDKHIYNLLQTSRVNKVCMHVYQCIINITDILQLTFSSLGLQQADKTAVFQKTCPCPKWYTPWRIRHFVLKGNFLYYYKPNTKVLYNNLTIYTMLFLLSTCVSGYVHFVEIV